MYKVEYTPKAIKELMKLDRGTSSMIYSWIDKNLINCTNPRGRGKGLTGDLSGQWRYRIGDYRIIAKIDDNTVTILVLTAGHRREIYNK